MTNPFVVPGTFYNNSARMILFLIFGVFFSAVTDANAFPVFCSDIKSYQKNMLTGCDLNADPLNLQREPPTDISLVEGTSEAMDAVLAMTPINRPLFQVGRIALLNDRAGKKDKESSTGEKQVESEFELDFKSSDAESGLLDRDDRWYYMNIDQDGTYLFFGDAPVTDERMINGDENGFLPEGIGIGKRWLF